MFNNLIIKVMKKILFLAAVTAIALTACTKTETTAVSEGNLIKFDNAFVGNVTKADVEDLTKDNIQHFYVFGTKTDVPDFFKNVLVTKNGSAWTYDALKQWEASEYTFAAYSNGGLNTTGDQLSNATWADNTLTITDYTVDQKDLVASISQTNINTTNQAVAFTFAHTLSMIKFTLESSLGDEDNAITISGFQVSGLKDKATLEYTSAGAQWTAPNESKTFVNDDITVTTTTSGESDSFVVIPQTVTDVKVSFTATIYGLDPKNLTATIADTWAPGYRYNYVATITGEDMDIIEFTLADVTPWDDTEWDTPIQEDID